MVEFPLNKNFEIALTNFNNIYDRIIKENNPELLKRFSIKYILDTVKSGLMRRDEIIRFASSLINNKKAGTEETTIIWSDKYIFEEIRFIALSSVLSACCGVYDNINYICRQLLKSNLDKSDIDTITDTIIKASGLRNHDKELIKIKEKYGFPLALLYSIRHNIFHRLHLIGGRIHKFKSKIMSDGYDCSRRSLLELVTESLNIFKVDKNWCCDNELLDALNSDEICFLKLLKLLIKNVDLCIIELFNYSISIHDKSSGL